MYDKYTLEENIARFRQLLTDEKCDPSKRATIEQLLAQEMEKLRALKPGERTK